MNSPSPDARAALDEHIKTLARLGDGLTLDDFRLERIEQAIQTSKTVRRTLYVCGLVFMAAVIVDFVEYKSFPNDGMAWMGIWAISLGGLGAIASVFLHVLKLIPKESLQPTDEFEVIGRIFLGCLFSVVLTFTITPTEIRDFYTYFGDGCRVTNPPASCNAGGPKLLLPFLCGYSIPLVLGLLEKIIRAVELTVGLDDRRQSFRSKTSGRK